MEDLLQHMADTPYSQVEQYQRLLPAAMSQHWCRSLYATTLVDNAAYIMAWEDCSSWKHHQY
jgi:hypothetical protein